MDRFQVLTALATPAHLLPPYEGWDCNAFGQHPRELRAQALQIRAATAGMSKEEEDKYYQDLRARKVNNFYSTIEALYSDRRVVLTAAEETENTNKAEGYMKRAQAKMRVLSAQTTTNGPPAPK